jgi:hypothetical protein
MVTKFSKSHNASIFRAEVFYPKDDMMVNLEVCSVLDVLLAVYKLQQAVPPHYHLNCPSTITHLAWDVPWWNKRVKKTAGPNKTAERTGVQYTYNDGFYSSNKFTLCPTVCIFQAYNLKSQKNGRHSCSMFRWSWVWSQSKDGITLPSSFVYFANPSRHKHR